MDIVESVRAWTTNLDRAVADFRAGDTAPLVRAITGCETKAQAAMLAIAVAMHLKPPEMEGLLDALTERATRDVEVHEFG